MKLDPLSIPYRTVETLSRLVPLVFVAAVVGRSAVDGPLLALVGVGAALAAVALAAAWQLAYYQRYEYRLTHDTFDIYSGVFSRREREIPYERIQNVSIDRSAIQRLFGLAVVELETAGGQGAEAALRYVSEEEATRLQDEISERKRGETDATAATATEQQGEPLYAISRTELALLGVLSFDVRLFPLLIGILSTVSRPLATAFTSSETVLAQASLTYILVRAPLIGAGLYVATALFSGLYAVTNYYAFRLWRASDELRFERGLLQRSSGTIPLEKVQTVFITENPLKRLFGYASLRVETAGFWPGEGGGSRAAIPIAKRDRLERLAREIEPYGSVEFERPPKRARERYMVRYLAVVALLVVAAWVGTRFTEYAYRWYAVGLLALPVPIAAHLKWKHRGYAILDSHVVTRNGFWSRRTDIVPYHRIQTVIASKTIFQRNRNLATLVIDTAGTSGLTGDDGMAVDIDADVAEELREQVADRLLHSLDERREQVRKRRRETLLGDSGRTGTSTGSAPSSDR